MNFKIALTPNLCDGTECETTIEWRAQNDGRGDAWLAMAMREVKEDRWS
jgi:hypothetical protein